MGTADILKAISEMLSSGMFGKKVEDVLQATRGCIIDYLKLKHTTEVLQNQQVELLKAMIGQPIYWWVEGWKMETHVIRNAEYRVCDTDFFDKKDRKFKGKLCVIIEVDEEGYYLADFIGETLFFNKDEVLQRVKDYEESKNNN